MLFVQRLRLVAKGLQQSPQSFSGMIYDKGITHQERMGCILDRIWPLAEVLICKPRPQPPHQNRLCHFRSVVMLTLIVSCAVAVDLISSFGCLGWAIGQIEPDACALVKDFLFIPVAERIPVVAYFRPPSQHVGLRGLYLLRISVLCAARLATRSPRCSSSSPCCWDFSLKGPTRQCAA